MLGNAIRTSLDYWETDYVQSMICSFGKFLSWERSKSRLPRLLVKAKVIDLQSVPKFIVFSATTSPGRKSWTIQCEIVGYEYVGAWPPVEEQVPQELNDHAPFDFFGLGQPGNGPVQGPIINDLNNNNDQFNENEDPNEQPGAME